jgi:hypothetical protein
MYRSFFIPDSFFFSCFFVFGVYIPYWRLNGFFICMFLLSLLLNCVRVPAPKIIFFFCFFLYSSYRKCILDTCIHTTLQENQNCFSEISVKVYVDYFILRRY